jgi:predicted DNA-binding transcriptional regulator YafY
MLDTSARLLTLLSLLQTRRDWPGQTLAERLRVTSRTIRRDVDRLRELGYPVRSIKGPDGGYRLEAGSELPPLRFDDDQAVAIAVALQTATTTVTGVEEGALRALATIRQVMPTRLRSRVNALQVTSVGRYRAGDRPIVDIEHLVTVGAAVRAREVLRFDYPTGRDGVSESMSTPPRRVEPHHLVTWDNRWYLVAWDLDRADWRTFRVDRMVPWTPTGPRFEPRTLPAPDVASYVTERFGRPVGLPCRGEAILHAPATEVARWTWGEAVVEELGPDRCRVVAGGWSWVGLAAWLGLFDVDVEIVGPAELREAAVTLAARYGRAVADNE